MRPLPAGWILALAATACASGAKPAAASRDTLTERQHDSVLAGSSIPGASAVGKAMRVADSASASVRAADSVP